MTDRPDFDDLKGPGEDRPDDGPVREGGADQRNLMEREVRVVGVFEQREEGAAPATPFVLIRDNQQRCVLIWIGKFEAFAISMAIEGASADRPLTHDLLKNITEKLGVTIDRVVIDDLWGDTYYAKIWMARNGGLIPVDARPSDAIALALRAKAPIFMTEAVLEEASRPCEELEGE